MKPLRVLLGKRFFPEDLELIKGGLQAEVELVEPCSYSPEALAEAAKLSIDVILGDLVTRPILTNAPHLKLIQVPWTGVDRLDFPLLREFGVTVCNSHSNAPAVAEMAVGLLLAITKKIPLHDRRLRQGDWMRPRPGVPGSHCPPTCLRGKTALFVGYGAVARQTAFMLSGFRMHLVATAVRPVTPVPAPLEALYAPSALNSLASQVDIVLLMVPLLPSTRGLIGERFLSCLRPSAYLINTSRGEIADEEALYSALRERRIAGAAIDTWYQHPKPDGSEVLPSLRFPFHELDNLVLSPHRAGFLDGDKPHLADVIKNINHLARNEQLENVVDCNAGY